MNNTDPAKELIDRALYLVTKARTHIVGCPLVDDYLKNAQLVLKQYRPPAEPPKDQKNSRDLLDSVSIALMQAINQKDECEKTIILLNGRIERQKTLIEGKESVIEERDKTIDRLKTEVDELTWNLAGCSSVATGACKPYDYHENHRPALDDVSRLSQDHKDMKAQRNIQDGVIAHLKSSLDCVTKERDELKSEVLEYQKVNAQLMQENSRLRLLDKTIAKSLTGDCGCIGGQVPVGDEPVAHPDNPIFSGLTADPMPAVPPPEPVGSLASLRVDLDRLGCRVTALENQKIPGRLK